MTNSLYISTASVQDKEIFNMIEQIYDLSDNPDSIYVGICHSVPFNNKKFIDDISNKINNKRVTNKFINFYRSQGVGFGRRGAMSMYSGQDYILQIDGHTNFQQSWDSQLFEIYNNIPKKIQSGKNLLTAYLPGYSIIENNKRKVFSEGFPMYAAYLSESDKDLNDYISNHTFDRFQYFENIPRWITNSDKSFYDFIKDNYVFSRKINANFIFSEKYFAEDYYKIVSWDFLFLEEEFFMSIEAINLGYSMIYPNMELPLAHLYSDKFNEFYNSSSRKIINPDKARWASCKKEINNYLNNPKNFDKIKKYCDYAGLEYPDFLSISTYYIPGENNAN